MPEHRSVLINDEMTRETLGNSVIRQKVRALGLKEQIAILTNC